VHVFNAGPETAFVGEHRMIGVSWDVMTVLQGGHW
jgi:hypothetical protein